MAAGAELVVREWAGRKVSALPVRRSEEEVQFPLGASCLFPLQTGALMPSGGLVVRAGRVCPCGFLTHQQQLFPEQICACVLLLRGPLWRGSEAERWEGAPQKEGAADWPALG